MDEESKNQRGEEQGLHEEDQTEAKKVEALEEEVVKLKEYINHNYNVFIKRLEKRKDKIVVLNEENASLREELSTLEGYKKQMLEYRENYEQLEEFQNQEMAKIKHMLLSSENTLQSEQREKEILQQENQKLKESLNVDSSSIIKELSEKTQRIKDLEESVQRLESDLTASSSDEKSEESKTHLESLLRETQKNFEAYKEASSSQNESDLVRILESQLSMVENERDAAKNSLLEMEIERHDSLENAKKNSADWKLQEAKMVAERETLEVKLSHRESEIKKLKEEARTMKESYDGKIKELEESSESKTYKIHSLEGQVSELKSELSKVKSDLEAKASNSLERASSFKRLSSELDSLRDTLKKRDAQLSLSKEGEASLKSDLGEQRRKFAQLNKELENCVSQMEELSSNRESLEMELISKGRALNEGETQIVKLQRRLKDIDENLPGTIESSDLVKGLKARISGLEKDLEERKTAHKLQEKRMQDMKKTVQKELSRNDVVSNASSPHSSFTPIRDATFLNGHHRKNSSSGSSVIDIPINDANVQYLKSAIFKFFTGRDDEAHQMIKVISTILRFSPDESRVLTDIWEWKHSWFASKPKVK